MVTTVNKLVSNVSKVKMSFNMVRSVKELVY